MNLEKVRLFVLIAILVGGLAASPVFSSSYSAFAQYDDAGDVERDETDQAERDEMEEVSDEMDKPTVCTMEYAPVCGTDGETYGNMCMLEASDAELAHEGECEIDEERDFERDTVRYHDRQCWETDDGELRCEGHDGKCWRTDEGIRCEVEHDYKRDIKMILDKYCEMTDEERDEFLAEHDYFREHHARLAEYCELSDDEREEYSKRHHDMMMDFKERHLDMIDEMKDRHSDIREFDKRIHEFCEMSVEEREELLAEHDFVREHHERMLEYCAMSEDERDDFRETHHDMMMDFKERFGMMRDAMISAHSDIRIQKMMERHAEITDERIDELKAKFRVHHADLTDEQRDEIRFEIKAKFDKHFKMKFKARHDALTDQHKADLLKRHAEMKTYKAELRERYHDMTDDEREQFRMDFVQKVKDVRFAWLSPHKQMMAGISVDEIECREGLNLVMKNSNGKAICMKSSTAEKLIERGIVVPAS